MFDPLCSGGDRLDGNHREDGGAKYDGGPTGGGDIESQVQWGGWREIMIIKNKQYFYSDN